MHNFELTVPREGRPVLVEVPHSGLSIPDEVSPQLEAPSPEAILRDSDLYVDALYEGVVGRGASMLVARTSRYVVDLNRAGTDVDGAAVVGAGGAAPSRSRGVVWSLTLGGQRLLRRPLTVDELRARLDQYHAPYHAALWAELERLRAVHGFAIMLAAHSMPSKGRDPQTGRVTRRADIVPGSDGRRTADPRLIDLVDAHFRAAGYTVAHDEPYRGGWSTVHYGRPSEGLHVLQIEINRDLYVDEATSRRKPTEFAALRSVLLDLVGHVGQLQLR